MAISFTKNQQQVIDTHGCNLLVSAAAGSGKTAVLVERIVKTVSDDKHPVDIDRLLVVTFTNAAASEMRERISLALQEKLAADPENEHLQRQATLLHNAQITTIDSFCLFVIRNQFYTIGLDPGFRIAEEGERKLLIKDVLAQVLEEGYAKGDPAFLDCMEYFSAGSRDSAVEEVCMRLYDFAMSNPFPERWLEERKQDYRMQENVPFEEISWVAAFLDETRRMLEGCVRKLGEAVLLCEEPDGPYFYGTLLEREKEMTEALLHKCGGDYETLYSAFETVRFDRLPSKKDDTVSPVKRELVKNIRAEVKETLAGLQERYFFQTKEQIAKQMEVCGTAVNSLIELVLSFKTAFDEKKREKNLLDFDDVEHFALAILTRFDEDGSSVPTETALEYRSHFHEILIDEYQDSNLVQEYLLSCISGEDEGRYDRFMVGDVKQSIYKFRLARPELFLEKYEEYAEIEENDSGKNANVKIDLHQNFRSRYEILNSTNSVFAQLMGREVGGILYDEQAALYLGAEYPASSGNDTELLLFKTEGKPEDVSVKEQEAYGVAAKIRQLMQGFRVTDKETGRLRQLSYKDIVILLRTTSGWDEVFKEILEGEGIPVYMTSRTGYFAAGEVQELLHFLRVLDNPLQDIPLYGVLHSGMGGFTEEEIALIRASYPEKKYLYDALVLCAGREGQEDGSSRQQGLSEGECLVTQELSEKIARFLAGVERYRDMAVYVSVHELLQTILRETEYLNYVAAKPDGRKRRANVEMLLVKAAEYEKTSYYGLYHFLRYMEQLEKYEVDYGEAGLQDENADVVRIMSIHKSKGLEFPVCFVCGLSKGFQKKDATAQMTLDVDAGIGVDYVDSRMRIRRKNLRKNVIANKILLDNLAEELRILYVAMTRAKEKLILTGTLKYPEKKAASLLLLQKQKGILLPYDVMLASSSFLDLVLAALARNKCLDEFYTCYGCEPDRQSLLHDKEMSIQITLGGWEETVEESLEETVLKEKEKDRLLRSSCEKDADAELMAQMSERFSYQYPHQNLSELYTKTTVSELKKAGMKEEEDFTFELYEEEPIVPYLPKFVKEDEQISGSKRGSAFHKVMELFDFRELTEKVNTDNGAALALAKSQLLKMREEGRLSEEYFEAVSLPKVAAFLQSSAAMRMGRAAREGKLYKEQPFVLGLEASRLKDTFPTEETVLVQGIIDVFFEEEDGYVVLDYKTDAVDTPEELVKRYQIQLDYYAEALEQIFGESNSGKGKHVREKIIYSFKLGREIVL